MKKFFGLVVILLVAFTSQAENGAGIDKSQIVWDIGYDLPSSCTVAVAIKPVTHAVVYTENKSGGFDVEIISRANSVSDLSDDNDVNEVFANVNTNTVSETDSSSLERNTNYEPSVKTSTSPSPKSNWITTNVGKLVI